MRLIFWLDGQILKFFTKIARNFNWLTGKSNFLLARAILIFASVRFFLTELQEETIQHSLTISGAYLFSLLSYSLVVELQVSADQFKEARSGFLFIWGLLTRLISLISLCLAPFSGRIFPKNHQSDRDWVFWLMFACFVYLLFVDKPPFKKSQAWQGFKNWLAGFSHQPQLQPVPVTLLNI